MNYHSIFLLLLGGFIAAGIAEVFSWSWVDETAGRVVGLALMTLYTAVVCYLARVV